MIKVGVIRGGIDNSYSDSISSGSHLISSLFGDKLNSDYRPVDIFIDRDGIWNISGVPVTFDMIKEKVDIVFNSLHGGFGSDGKIQKILEDNNIPYTGSNSNICSFISDRSVVKEELSKIGINTPAHILYEAYLEDLDGPINSYIINKSRDVISRMPPPWIVKPLTTSSSMGTFVCKTYNDLIRAFGFGVKEKVSILVEELIDGKSASIGVINNFRNKDIYPLLCSGNFTSDEKREVERLAEIVHSSLNMRHYSQINFIVNPKKGVYFIDVNALPLLHDKSLFSEHLKDIGSSIPDFINHIIKLV